MSTFRKFLSSSVGTKVVIAATGLLLVGFLIAHLAGNLIILVGRDPFNHYSEKLTANKPILYAMEIGLLAVFVVHVAMTVTNWVRNRRARPQRYQKKELAGAPSRKTVSSSTMIATGTFVLVFLVIHLKTFKWGPWYELGGIRDLARLEFEIFANPLWVAFYVLAMILVGSHLRHGISSALQSLGLDHPGATPWILRGGILLAAALALGFAVIPIAVYVLGGRS